jgi:hypothetical protein
MGIKLKNGLTPKQNKLVEVVAKQIIQTGNTNITQAGLQVYNSKNPETARVIASQTIQQPTVKTALEEALATNGITTSGILKNVQKIADSQLPDKISAETILKANIEALKVLNAYPSTKKDNKVVNITQNIRNMTYSEAKKEYEALEGEVTELIDEAE